MQKSYVVKATLCLEECQFYLRAGDVLSFETVAHRLTVYRGNDIVKTVKQTPLSIQAMLKTGILTEVSTVPPVVAPVPPAPSKSVTAVQPAKPSTEEERKQKRGKAHATVLTEQSARLKEALKGRVPPVDADPPGAPALIEGQ